MTRIYDRFTRRSKLIYSQSKRKAKRWAARGFFSLPALSKFDPRRKVTDLKRHCKQVGVFPKSGVECEDWYLKIRNPEMIRRTPSITIDESDAARFRDSASIYQHGNHVQIPEVFLACVYSSKIVSRDCVVLSRENKIFMESALGNPEILEANGILDRFGIPRSTRHFRELSLISQPWSHMYYHWLLEALPRLSIIERFQQLENVPLAVLSPVTKFQQQSLELAGFPSNRVVEFDGSCWSTDRLFFPQTLAPSGNPSPHAVAWLRARFLKLELVPQTALCRRIYLTRRDASQRRLLNEEEIIEFLRDKGFEIICPGDMSFSEQIRTFSDVGIVIAPHGAGATNMVFAPPGATLIEFFGDNYINGCFWALANICRHKHAFLIGKSEWLDYTISLDSLKILLKRVVAI